MAEPEVGPTLRAVVRELNDAINSKSTTTPDPAAGALSARHTDEVATVEDALAIIKDTGSLELQVKKALQRLAKVARYDGAGKLRTPPTPAFTNGLAALLDDTTGISSSTPADATTIIKPALIAVFNPLQTDEAARDRVYDQLSGLTPLQTRALLEAATNDAAITGGGRRRRKSRKARKARKSRRSRRSRRSRISRRSRRARMMV